MKHNFKTAFLAFVITLFAFGTLLAQTNPIPHNLATSALVFTNFGTTGGTITEYPAGFNGWNTNKRYVVPSGTPVPTDMVPVGDEPLQANSTGDGTKIRNGLDRGFNIRVDQVALATYPVSIVAAVSNKGVNGNIKVTYDINGFNQNDVVTVSGIQLQYRTDTVGAWVNVPNGRYQATGRAASVLSSVSVEIGNVSDKDVIQFQWMYFVETADAPAPAPGNKGHRIELRNINISLLPTLSHPNPHILASGNFVFSGFLDGATTTYPSGMQGWGANRTIVLPGGTPPIDAQPGYDINLSASTAAASTISIKNEAANGISIRHQKSTAFLPQSVVVALNTTNSSNITLEWNAITNFSYADGVKSGVQAQYRVGNTGNWANISGHQYTSVNTNAPASAFGPTALPAVVEGKPLVQIRWLYYTTVNDDPLTSSPADRIAIDEIKLKVTTVTPVVKPVANYAFVVTNNNVTFTDQSTNLPFNWLWTFDDGSTSTLQNPVHDYTIGGTYKVKLKVSNSAGADSITKDVMIASAPEADFSSTINGRDVQFTDASKNTPTSWKWKFGDGVTASTQSPAHKYTANGTYDVELIAINSLGSDTIVKQVTVEKVIIKPLAGFKFTIVDSTVTFTDTSINDPESWFWSFGDEVTSVAQSPIHKYAGPGTYTVKLKVMNIAGVDSVIKTVTIGSQGLAPVAKYDFIATNLAVAFSDSSTNNPISWYWTFGDGTNSIDKNPSHTYANAGTYTVKLLVSNAAGKDSVTKDVTVTKVGLAAELEVAKSVKIYPNPATTEFTVAYDQFSKSSETIISVIDINGKELRRMQMNSAIQTVNASKLEQGVYLIRISDKNNSFTRRVEIVR